MGSNDSAKAAAVLSGSAAILSGMAWLNSRKAQAAPQPGEFPPELMELLIAMAQTQGEILEALKGLNVSVRGYPPNADYLVTFWVPCQVVNQAYELPELAVADDFSILIKASPLNAVGSLIYVKSGPGANVAMAYPLIFNEAFPFRLKTTKGIVVFSNIAGSQAVVSVEQRSG